MADSGAAEFELITAGSLFWHSVWFRSSWSAQSDPYRKVFTPKVFTHRNVLHNLAGRHWITVAPNWKCQLGPAGRWEEVLKRRKKLTLIIRYSFMILFPCMHIYLQFTCAYTKIHKQEDNLNAEFLIGSHRNSFS